MPNNVYPNDQGNVGHLVGNTAAPTIAAGTGAGTSPTVSVAGTDLSGTITVLTGTTPTASAVVSTVTFNSPYSAAPRVVVTPASATAIALSGTGAVGVIQANVTATTFALNVGSAALAATTTYVWNYHVAQ